MGTGQRFSLTSNSAPSPSRCSLGEGSGTLGRKTGALAPLPDPWVRSPCHYSLRGLLGARRHAHTHTGPLGPKGEVYVDYGDSAEAIRSYDRVVDQGIVPSISRDDLSPLATQYGVSIEAIAIAHGIPDHEDESSQRIYDESFLPLSPPGRATLGPRPSAPGPPPSEICPPQPMGVMASTTPYPGSREQLLPIRQVQIVPRWRSGAGQAPDGK